MLTVQINLKDILKENKLTQKELASLTGIRQAAISELLNKKRRSVNLDHLERIINELEIEEVTKILKITKDG